MLRMYVLINTAIYSPMEVFICKLVHACVVLAERHFRCQGSNVWRLMFLVCVLRQCSLQSAGFALKNIIYICFFFVAFLFISCFVIWFIEDF